jgi:hypothetical protein
MRERFDDDDHDDDDDDDGRAEWISGLADGCSGAEEPHSSSGRVRLRGPGAGLILCGGALDS